MSVLAKRLRALPPLPLSLPPDDDRLLKIIAIQDRFVLGLHRRGMKAISYLSQIEKKLGVAATTRNWNTIEKVAKILQSKIFNSYFLIFTFFLMAYGAIRSQSVSV